MPQLRASRRPLFFTFLACQLLLNATLSSAAVIRRERRQISTVSVTETTPYRTDAETVKPTTENEFEILGEKEADTEVATTVVSEKNASPAQVTRHFGDEWRDDEYEADDEEEGRPATETTVKTKGIEEVTNEAVREGDTRSLDIQMSTANTVDPETEGTTASSRAVLTTNEGTMPTTSPPESESTPRVTFDSTTFSETGLADDATEFKPTREDVALSTHEPETTDASRDSTQSATEEPGQPTEVISTTVVSRGNVEKSTDKIGSPDAEFSQTTTAGETTTDYTTTDGSKFQTSTKLVEETTLLSKFKDDSTTSSSDDTTMMSTNEQSKPLTPTFKSDDPTMLFLTSTETFDEDGAQTTFEARPLIQEPSTSLDEKSSTPTSAEKRGKFIDDNYSYLNELRLSNTTDSWGSGKTGERSKSTELLNSVETSDEKAVNHSMVTKTLLDWSRVMMSTDAMASHTTAKVTEHTNPTADAIATETSTTQETSTMKPVTTDVENLTNRIDSTAVAENEVVTNLPETTTAAPSKETVPTTPDQHSVDDTSLPHTEDIFSTTALPEVGVTATATTIIETTTIKGETTHQPAVNSETTEDQNTGATSSVSIIDFTTPPPFLTQTTVTITTTSAKTSTTPEIAFSMDDRTNETPDMASTHIPEHEATTVTLQQITTPTPTTSTTTPAVTVTAATTDETQKTETEARTPAIISDDTAQQSEARNSNNTTDNDDDNIYAEVSSETPTAATSTKSADSSSREAFEASTRVGPNWASASTANTRIHTAEVNSLDDPDESTVSSFETSNTYGDREPAASPTTTTTPAGGILKFVTDTHPIATATAATSKGTQPAEEDLERIDSIQKITDTGEASIESNVIDPLQAGEASTTTTTTSAPPPPPAPVPTATTQTTTSTTTTTSPTEKSEDNMRMPSTDRGWAAGDSSSTTTLPTTTSTAGPAYDDTTTPLQSISTKNEDLYSILPPIDSGGGFHVPKLNVDDTTSAMPGILTAGAGQPMDTTDGQETDVNVIIAISVSVVGIVALILLVAFLYVMRKRQKQMSYGQRCRPVSLDAYSLDNVSVYNSVRRKGAALRASKRSYGNVAFDDPSLRHNVLGTHELAKFVEKKSSIWDEFKDVPQIIARADEVPAGCEDKNRYANVIPLPETRVILQQQNGDEKTEYINANYVRGPKDTANYYIACQAPLETTVIDFWRMIWEQNSRVIIMATDLIENGIDKCAEYLPPSVTLDNHTVFGDFQVTLKNREVKEKYAISTLLLKNTATDESREITHYWYQWPETGVPTDEAAVIAMLLEARSSLKAYALEQSDTKIDTIITEESQTAKKEINGNVTSEKPKPPSKDQGPLTIHCSPGTGRTGTILAIDIAMRCLEEPKRCVDIPQIVYSVRRGRASAVQTKEQYEFIYKVTHVYATKISNLNSDN